MSSTRDDGDEGRTLHLSAHCGFDISLVKGGKSTLKFLSLGLYIVVQTSAKHCPMILFLSQFSSSSVSLRSI